MYCNGHTSEGPGSSVPSTSNYKCVFDDVCAIIDSRGKGLETDHVRTLFCMYNNHFL